MQNNWKPYLKLAHWNPNLIHNLDSVPISGRLRSVLEAIPGLYHRMKNDNIEQYFESTIHDIEFRILRYKKEHGIYGLSAHDIVWTKPILEYNFFQVGPLRYQFFEMYYRQLERSGRDYLELSPEFKRRHKKGAPYIMIHIPRGASLEINTVKTSMIESYDLMQKLHPQINFEGFIIRAWLVHPSIDELLPKTSKIYQFKQLFEIVGDAPIAYQMLNRVFGTDNVSEIQQFIPKTSLQLAIKEQIHHIGVGIGFISLETLSQL